MKTILFQGDSITDAMRCRENDDYRGCGYPTIVAGKLMYEHPGEYRCVNRGISGDRIVNIIERMRRDIENVQPDVMSLLIGVNGVWHETSEHDGVPADRFERMLDVLLNELELSLPQTKLMLLEPFYLYGAATCDTEKIPDRWKQYTEGMPLRAQAVRRMAEKHHCLFIPLQQRFDDLAAKYGAECWLLDGVHPSAAGHTVIAEEWLKGYAQLK